MRTATIGAKVTRCQDFFLQHHFHREINGTVFPEPRGIMSYFLHGQLSSRLVRWPSHKLDQPQLLGDYFLDMKWIYCTAERLSSDLETTIRINPEPYLKPIQEILRSSANTLDYLPFWWASDLLVGFGSDRTIVSRSIPRAGGYKLAWSFVLTAAGLRSRLDRERRITPIMPLQRANASRSVSNSADAQL